MSGKKQRVLFSMFMALVIIVFSFGKVKAGENEKIKLKVNAGFDSIYRINNTVPINIEIENNLKDINGEIQVEVDTSQMDNQNTVTIYAQNITLPNNSSKSITMNIPILKYITKLKINIVEDKNTVFEKTVGISGGLNYESMLIGILSDDYDSISYINDIKITGNTNYSVKNVKLSEKTLSEDSDVLKNFNAIVINNFDTSKLTSAQYNGLKKWVNDGGMLLIGTGASYSKTLWIFKNDDFITGEIGGLKDISTKEFYKLVGDNSSKAFDLSCVSMNIKGSSTPIKEGNFPLVHRIEKGKGIVSIASFDFGLNPIAGWTQKGFFSSKLIGNLLPNYYISYAGKGTSIEKDPYIITNTLRNIAELPMPKTKVLTIIFLVYILLAAPINYLILKKLDKREFMWITVPALSVIFGIVMYILGFSTRITQPIANVFSSIAIDKNGTGVPSIYAGIFTPSKKDIKIENSEDMNMKPIPDLNYNYAAQTSGEARKIVEAKVMLGSKGFIEFYGNSIFSSKSLAVGSHNVSVGKIDCNLNYSNGVFKGEINNESNFDLDEAYIVTSNNFIRLKSIKKEEKKSINEKGETYNGNIYEFTNKVWVNPYSGPNPKTNFTDEETAELRKNEQKRAALNLVFQDRNMKVTQPTLIAFTNDSITKEIIVNSKVVKKYERTVVTSDVNLTFRKGNTVEYPLGYIKPKVTFDNIRGGYDEMAGIFYGNGAFQANFQMDRDIDVEKVNIYFKYQGISNPGDIKEYVWNYKSGKYEETDLTKLIIDKEKISKYIGKDNFLKLKIEIMNMKGNVEIPSISVKGSVK